MPQKRASSRLERRTSARADANLSMRVEGRPADGDLTLVETESQNISSSGVYCTSPHYLAPLSKVALTIVLPNRTSTTGRNSLLKCSGIVVRCMPAGAPTRPSGYQLACSFIGLDARHQAAITEFVTWRNLQELRRTTTRKTAARKRRTAAAATPRRRTTSPRARTTRARRASGR
jgi:hypothetical protein